MSWSNKMLRSAICIVWCGNKNGKYRTKILMTVHFNRWSISVGLVTWIDYEATIVSFWSHFKPTGKKTFCAPPPPSEIYLFQTLLQLRIPITLCGVGMNILWNYTLTVKNGEGYCVMDQSIPKPPPPPPPPPRANPGAFDFFWKILVKLPAMLPVVTVICPTR